MIYPISLFLFYLYLFAPSSIPPLASCSEKQHWEKQRMMRRGGGGGRWDLLLQMFVNNVNLSVFLEIVPATHPLSTHPQDEGDKKRVEKLN